MSLRSGEGRAELGCLGRGPWERDLLLLRRRDVEELFVPEQRRRVRGWVRFEVCGDMV